MSASRILVLLDPSFPGYPGGGGEGVGAGNMFAAAGEGLEPADAGEAEVKAGLVARFERQAAEELAGRLDRAGAGDCFVNLHAPYFPKGAWTSILAFLKRGGGLVSLGGAPFKHPVSRREDGWHAEPEQPGYHRQLHIHEALRVDGSRASVYEANGDIPVCAGQEELLAGTEAWNLVPHVTKASDLPHQMGSAGPMDTRVYPLLTGGTGEGRQVSAPVVLWEHGNGPFRGGRWIFAGRLPGSMLRREAGRAAVKRWAHYAAEGVTDLWIKPGYASYEPGERAVLTLQAQRISRRPAEGPEEWSYEVTVEREDGGAEGYCHRGQLPVTGELNLMRLPVPLEIAPGLYRVVCRMRGPDGAERVLRQGFWGCDAALLAAGEPLAAGRDYFRRGGRPFPVVGMTYMASDVARKFLFLPNAHVWDRDMERMAAAGINWIRTGIWTAYRNIMQVDGHVSEEVLRAVDAFLLTAKKHGLETTFTFFSFTPEAWEGVNPYLDPRSIEAQKRFIRSFVSRHRSTAYVNWDLINEPSMFDPARIFSEGPRSARDAFERRAYSEWLKQRHGTMDLLQERWGMTPEELPDFAAAMPPEPEEINFDVQDMHSGKRGARWLDYCLFSMEMHNRWAKELGGTIKELAPWQLVTVGQDEALGAQRPSPFFYQEAVDYTTVHPWWLNDQLVWSGVFAKTPDKPNLAQEVGIMYVETADGRAKRSEEELRSILERKYAYSFATGGAGAVHWIWNTNFYMDNANESHIGALRSDGTEKPEADVSCEFGRFMASVGGLFTERRLEDIAVVFPYSNDFSNRKMAFDATARLARVLAYQLHLPFRGVSEYHLEALERQPAKLIMVPSAHNIGDDAMTRLLGIVERTGAALLVTGPAGIDAYWHPTGRMDQYLGRLEQRNVRREELLLLGAAAYPVSYGKRRIAEVTKEGPAGGMLGSGADAGESNVPSGTADPSGAAEPWSHGSGDTVMDAPLGAGRLIWCPLPLELNDRDEPLLALYRYAAECAGVKEELEWLSGGGLPGVYGRKLTFPGGALFVFVSEYAWDVPLRIRDRETGAAYRFTLEKERSVLFAADTYGRVTAVYRPAEVDISVE